MLRVLLIDDEPFYFKLIAPVFRKAGYDLEYAKSGNEGLTKLQAYNPDVIVLDVRLPDLTGFEILQRLRRDPRFVSIPVIFVTGQNELDDKLKAFDMGADDYLEKPFQPEELVARLAILARRSQALKAVQQIDGEREDTSTLVAVHSLRGGAGCSSVAVNLGIAFSELWLKPTLLVDAVLAAGQVAMMLDTAPNVTWEDFVDIPSTSMDDEMATQLISKHRSGVNFVAAPRFPIASDSFSNEFIRAVLERFKHLYEFVIIDTAHDFSDLTIEMLTIADYILLVLAPEMASLRAAICALDIYDKLGFPPEKVKLSLNQTISSAGIKQAQIEKVLNRPVELVVPHGGGDISRAINFGEPFLWKNPDSPVTAYLEDIAYQLSKEYYKNIPPVSPTATWKRVTKRLSERK